MQRLLSPAIARAARKVEGQPEEDVLENERPKREARAPAAVAVVDRLAREALGRVRWIRGKATTLYPGGGHTMRQDGRWTSS